MRSSDRQALTGVFDAVTGSGGEPVPAPSRTGLRPLDPGTLPVGPKPPSWAPKRPLSTPGRPDLFTGIVETTTVVRRAEPQGTGLRVWLPTPRLPEGRFDTGPGDSIALSGACMTVAGFCRPGEVEPLEPGVPLPESPDLVFDLSAESLQRTWFDRLEEGSVLNLERAMKLGDRLDGHMVSGHVDGGGTIVKIEDSGDGGKRVFYEVDEGLERYLIEKGSVTLDGISLTVVEPQGRGFHVAVIPTTLEVTSLGAAKVGDRVNVEADLIGKWVERLAVR